MIDKLDIFISADHCKLSSALSAELWEQRSYGGTSLIRGFTERRTFRHRKDWHFDVHLARRNGSPIAFRIDITEAGRRDLRTSLDTVGHLFGTDITRAQVKRLDLAVDVPDVPLSWFRTHVIVSRKRRYREFDCVKMQSDTKEGVIWGKRPNVIRIYDKALQLAASRRPSSSQTMTRVERQFGGSVLRAEFATIARLLETVANYRPFTQIRFRQVADELDISALDGLEGMRLVEAAGAMWLNQELGAQEFRRRLGSNRARTLEKLSALVKAKPSPTIDLNSLFQQSISSQLDGSSISTLKLSA